MGIFHGQASCLVSREGNYSEKKLVDLYKVNSDVKKRTLIDPIYILKDSAHKNESLGGGLKPFFYSPENWGDDPTKLC